MGQEGFEPTKLSSYELLALPVELLSQRGGFNHVTTSARSKRLTKFAIYSVASVDTTLETAIHWCLSSKAALLIHSPLVWAPTKLDHNSGHPIAYSCCHQTITPRGATSSQSVRTFSDISVMGVSEGEYEHPRWNFATPAASYYSTPLHRT